MLRNSTTQRDVTSEVRHRESGQPAFLKELRSHKVAKARARFRSEITSYETLQHPRIPNVLEHNSETWREPTTRLYAVLELIPGPDLRDYVSANGPLTSTDSLALTRTLAETLDHCHRIGVIHRDVKPGNVVLRGSSPKDPFLVDFGLSFNLVDTSEDLTEVEEEVGNRFLRLPEQSFSTRSAITDLTQLTGLLIYSLTGIEPRSLIDGHGRMPHQRNPASQLRNEHFTGLQHRRLAALFDKGFAPRTALRFQSAEQLLAALGLVEQEDSPSERLDGLAAALDEHLATGSVVRRRDTSRVLSEYSARMRSAVSSLAKAKGLARSGANEHSDSESPVPFTRTEMGIGVATAAKMSEFRVELHGTDAVLLIDGVPQWRGVAPDADFDEAVQAAVIEAFLSS